MNAIDIVLIVVAIVFLILAIKFAKKLVVGLLGLLGLVIVAGIFLYFLGNWDPIKDSWIMAAVLDSRIGGFLFHSVNFIANLFK